jgi:hypothetical protein
VVEVGGSISYTLRSPVRFTEPITVGMRQGEGITPGVTQEHETAGEHLGQRSALTAAIWHNRAIGQTVTRSLITYNQ